MKAKKKMKRLLSFLLALAMVVGMLPATSMTAQAETSIKSATVLGVTKPIAGSVPTTDGISLGENVEIVTEGTVWVVFDEETLSYSYMDDKTATFTAGKKYGLQIGAKPKAGYAFADEIEVLYNESKLSSPGSPGNNSFTVYTEEAGEIAGYMMIWLFFDAVDPITIDTVDVKITEPVAGTHPQDAVSNTKHVEMGSTAWEYNGKVLSSSYTFEAGKTYKVTVMVGTEDKYTFVDNPTVTFNGSTKGTISEPGSELMEYYAEYTVLVPDSADFETDPDSALALLNAHKTEGAADSTWDAAKNILTLNGVNFATSAATAVKLPDCATIILHGENTITGGDSDSSSCYGIYSTDIIYIEGDGKLTVTAGDATNAESDGVKAESLRIDAGDVTAIGGTAKKSSGINTSGDLIVDGGVTAKGSTATSESFGIKNGVIMYSGTLLATGETQALGSAPDLSSLNDYRWRTANSDPYSEYPDTRYTWASAHKYVEIGETGPKYTITVTDGKATAGGVDVSKAEEGTEVTLTANAAPSGKLFDKWVVEEESASITLADAGSETTTFTMPASAVSVKATYKNKPIDSVDVKIAVPKAGNHPKNAVSNTANVSVDATTWSHGEETLSASYSFIQEETYVVTVKVKPDSGYCFADNPAVMINGSATGTVVSAAKDSIEYRAEFTASAAPKPATEVANFGHDPTAALALFNAAKTGTEDSTWDATTKTLTLNGVNFVTTSQQALALPGGSTIILHDENTITGGNSSLNCYGIFAGGSLTIEGDGKLTVTGGNVTADINGFVTSSSSYGIYANSLIIKGGDVTAIAGTTIKGKTQALSNAPDLSALKDYWWRTSNITTYTDGSASPYTWDASHQYAEFRSTYPDYNLTVTDGKATAGEGNVITKAAEGTVVTLTANAAPSGKVFDKWVVEEGSASITLADANSVTTTFTMPAGAVIVKATYKDLHTHSYSDIWKKDKDKHWKSCECGEKSEEAAHTAGDWIVDTEATATAVGSKYKQCSVCGYKLETDVIPATGTPQTGNQNGIITDEQGSSYKVTKSDAKAGEVTFAKPKSRAKGTVKIPDTVTIDGVTYRVTAIEAGAFKNNKSITKVTIGKYVMVIGKNAFSGCTKLKTVKLGAAVATIADKAFYKCSSLTSITIPAKVTKIGKSAFEGCKKLKTITVKTTKLKSVGKRAFKGIHAKAKIKVPKSKLKKYKSLFKNKGQGKKVKITK